MSYGYGGRQNPFDDRNGGVDDTYSAGGGYGGGLPSGPRGGGLPPGPRTGSNRYDQGPPTAMGRDDYGSNNVEMESLTQNATSFGQGDPNAILNECMDINRGIDTIDENLDQMKMLQQRALDDPDSSASSSTNRQLDALSSETMAHYRSLTGRVRQVKSSPESQQPKNAPQVGRMDRRLKQAIQSYQQVESQFRKKTQDQMARQYRIVRPDADETEVQAAVEDPTGGQIFQQALMQSNRRGQAQSVLSAVQDRHAQLQKIEQQMIELAQLFQDMDTLVIQQEVAVTNIEQKAEETVENFDKGNEEIGTAINTARSTRKKKWICLAIVVGIIVVIAIVVVVYIMINKQNTSTTTKKRWLADSLRQERTIKDRAWDESNPVPELLTDRDEAKLETRYIKLFRGETAKAGRSLAESDPATQFLTERVNAQVEKRWVTDIAPKEDMVSKRWVAQGGTFDVFVDPTPEKRSIVPGQAFVPRAAIN